MAKPGQSSFRRLLLSRILLLSIPVLLTGELVTYNKVRSGLLATARQNLTESAVRKGENIRDLVEVMRSNLVTASEAFSTQIDRPQEAQEFVARMNRWLPKGVQCVQLINVQTGQIDGSTCGNRAISQVLDNLWSTQSQVLPPLSSVRIAPVNHTKVAKQSTPLRQLDLVFSAPVYDSLGRLRYALSIQWAVHRQETSQPGSLSGYTVVIDEDGTILAHPKDDRIGRNIRQEADATRLQDIVNSTLAGKEDPINPLFFEDSSGKWLAGSNRTEISFNASENRTWVVLAVAPLNNALSGLEDLKQVLLVLTIGLVGANLLATLYIARELARPMEKLVNYAFHIYQRRPSDQAPKNFKVKEINQLAEALDNMVERLEERAEELEAAWQEAQAANQMKSEFLATTSHELRTPLNAIFGCIGLVKDDCCDSREEEMELLQQADQSARHLLKIIDDLLNIAKIEAGQLELSLQPVVIQDLCRECLKMVQPAAEKKRLSLIIDVDKHLSHVVLDQLRVRQMVINLLSNAVKFTPEGGQVKLSSRIGYGHQLEQDARPDHSPVNASTPYLCLEVTDSGIGIPPERWHLLFRPFQQVDSSLTRRHEGTGLGLALTKRFAELHGGTVSFQSTIGKGSTFRIWLPSREPTPVETSSGGDRSGPGTHSRETTRDAANSVLHPDVPDHSVSSIS
ncbi:sensor histidine kinase [Phormidium sp. FACHB-592]|uniref:histidine kinase n=1 Tax=Stenomitos frigidus AS-A4 TaxID=2933935 RepID=A0ABV0KPE3_9CYAN|nr:ATP-binding protein [Phormidium sp. FACHB-592]MBD2074936.1 sensor histidine kinase [Phormidium sp. FACHB-592]